ncbi:class I SAM-dependent methyltransferase [Actinosynnema sp. NPDC059335]|uniref:class I SAM-dependent methyltransferase n=1 Tax=Actinosynnema sp. NPDC059335 TaxID=3346804 RepID=UPI003671DA1B
MSDARSVLRAAFDALAGAYDPAEVDYFRPVGRRVVELAGVGAGERVLDVGCGRGAALFPAAEAVGERGRAVGIDLSGAMVAATADEARSRGLRQVEVRRMDGQEPDFPPGSFDAVIGSMSVHMLPDTGAAFARFHELLAPGGRLCVSAPTTVLVPQPRVFGLASIARWVRRYESGTRVYPQSDAFGGAERVEADLRAAGFRSVDVRDEPLTLTAPSGRALVAWTWTHGMRLFWERVPAERRAEVAADIEAEAERYRDPATGRLAIPTPVRYVTAR